MREAPTGSPTLPDALAPDHVGQATPEDATRRPTIEGESEPEAKGHPGRPAGPSLNHVLSVVGSVVAPATLVSALLFYFGYVSARAQFGYFGVDVDVLGFSTQEFVMRAPQPLLVPALLLLLGSAGLTWAHGVVRRRLESTDVVARRVVLGLTGGGAVFLTAGLCLLLAFPLLGSWAAYPLVTPMALGVGAGFIALAIRWSDRSRTHTGTTVVLLVVVVVATVFWATATLAQWSGTGRAKVLARDLTSLPAVVVDLPERLVAGDDSVLESALPAEAEQGQTYRYRYRGFRLLAEGDGRLFLVPERWSPSGSTFIVDVGEARVRFRFVDDPP